MSQHVIFVAPFFMQASLRFLAGATSLAGVRVSLISVDPADRLPDGIRGRLAGHWRIDDGLDATRILAGARKLESTLGRADRIFGPLEQLQVPLAEVRSALGLPGLGVEAATNFRDKSRMKDVLREAGVPCARHALVGSVEAAREFVGTVGFPVVVKPPAGAGGKGTFRLDSPSDLEGLLQRFPPQPAHPTLFEEFVSGAEYSFDSVMIGGKPVWYSMSRYLPSPLDVLENAWIQWSVLLPRDIDDDEFTAVIEPAFAGLRALGMETGFSHMEWFRLARGNIAISEVGARPPGAQFSSLISYAHDFDLYTAWPHLMVFDEFDPPQRRYAVGAAYFRGQGHGRVRNIAGLDEAQRRYGELVVEVQLPQLGQNPADGYEGDGFVIIRHADTAVVESALADIVRIVRVELG